MMNAQMDAMAAVQKKKDSELVRFKQQMDGLRKQLANTPEAKKQLQKACKDFEAIFIGKMWKEMQKTVPKDGYLHGPQDEMYLSMFDQAFSEKMADDGGIGLADMMYDQLSQRLDHAGKHAPAGKVRPLAENGKAEIRPLNANDGQPDGIAMTSEQLAQTADAAGETQLVSGRRAMHLVDALAARIVQEQAVAEASAERPGEGDVDKTVWTVLR